MGKGFGSELYKDLLVLFGWATSIMQIIQSYMCKIRLSV